MLRYMLVVLLLHSVNSVCSPGKLVDFIRRSDGSRGVSFRKNLCTSAQMRARIGAKKSVVDTFHFNQGCSLILRSFRISFLGKCEVQVIASETEISALLGSGDTLFNHTLTCEETGECWTTRNSWVLPRRHIQGKVLTVRVVSGGDCTVLTCGQGGWDGAILYASGFADIEECLSGSHNCQAGSQCQNTLGSYECLGITVASSASTANSFTTVAPSITSTPRFPTRILSSTTAPTARGYVTTSTLDVTPSIVTGAFSPGNSATGLERTVELAIIASVAAILVIGGLLVACLVYVRCNRPGTLRQLPFTRSNSSTTSTHPTRNSMPVANAIYEISPAVGTIEAAQLAPDSNYNTLFQMSLTEQQEQEALTRNATGNILLKMNPPIRSDSPPLREIDASYAHVILPRDFAGWDQDVEYSVLSRGTAVSK